MSPRLDVITEMANRLAAVLKVNGYNTDAGLNVLKGETPTLGPSDPASALALVVRDDSVTHQGMNVVSVLPVEVLALVKVGTPGSLIAIEQLIEDIKRAIETPDRTLGGRLQSRGLARGQTKALEREDGSEFVGASVEYLLTVAEKWGGQ